MAEKNKKSSKVDKTKEQKEFVPLKVDDSASRTESNVKVNDKRQSSTVNSSTGAVAKTEVEDGSWKVFLFFVIATLLIIVALAIIGSDKGNGKVLGKLIVEDEVRYGRSTDIVLELDEEIKIEENTPISWLMDNVEVKRENYVDGKGTKLSVMPSRTGNHKVTVKIGKNHYNEINIDVLKPKLSLCAQDTTIVYGDELPEFTYTIKGLVDNETMEQLGYDGKVVTENQPLTVGLYKLKLDREFSSEKYDVEFSEATLEVLPKKVNISGTFVKEYDGNNALNSKIAQLNGVAEGDDVRLAETTIYFSDKQVGKDKVINGFNLMLEGEDAKNYCIEEPTLTGIILPKRIELVGTKVAHKYYNGTTDAKISDLGTLKGVLEGDTVAMGSITAKFEDAESGNNKKIIFSDLSLIGKDKDNYEVVVVGEHTANIMRYALDSLLNKGGYVPADD